MSEEELRLRGEIAELEGRLRSQRQATATAARTADLVLERIQAWAPVVKAARELAEDPNHVNRMFALLEAVEALPPDPTT